MLISLPGYAGGGLAYHVLAIIIDTPRLHSLRCYSITVGRIADYCINTAYDSSMFVKNFVNFGPVICKILWRVCRGLVGARFRCFHRSSWTDVY